MQTRWTADNRGHNKPPELVKHSEIPHLTSANESRFSPILRVNAMRDNSRALRMVDARDGGDTR